MAIKLAGGKMRLLLHIAAWAIIIGLPIYNFSRWDVPREFIWYFYLTVTINGIIFYINYLLLIPRYFFKNKRLKYYLSAFFLIATMFIISVVSGHLIFEKIRTQRPPDADGDRIERREPRGDDRADGRRRIFRLPFGPMSVYNYTFNALVYTVFAFGLKVLERHAEIEKKQKELEKEKLNSELAFLKNQISPHFFFNTLNNIYSLIGINTHDSQEAVLKLSRMMRYLLYESEQGTTRLSNEIEFMNNYIDLMRLRISDKVKLDVNFPSEYENVAIPPLLFISVIENAFKHGISYREKSFITISMQVSKELINFRCINSLITKSDQEEKKENQGIGLENLKKRLALLFNDKHKLKIDRSGNTFEVAVTIFLN